MKILFKKSMMTISGFTLLELLISAFLGLMIAGFSLQSLHDLMFTERLANETYENTVLTNRVLDNVTNATEMSGFIPEEFVSFSSSWNYNDAADNFGVGEIIRVDNTNPSELIVLRLYGDSYSEFRDCLGGLVAANTVVYMIYSLADEVLSCEANHYTAAGIKISSNKQAIADRIMAVSVTAMLRNDAGDWKVLSKTKTDSEYSLVKAVLFELVAHSEASIFSEDKTQKIQFFNNTVSYQSKKLLHYDARVLNLLNQEHQND